MEAKKYGVIVADPPWSYRNAGLDTAAANHYETQTDGWVNSLEVGALAADDSVLLLWGVWPKLPECIAVALAWGFEYKTGFPWVKVNSVFDDAFEGTRFTVPYGIGFWIRGASEVVLVCTKGKPSPPTDGWIGLLSPNLGHSRKPDSIYQYAESLPGPYLEMFARRKREGWDAFGNEIDGSIMIGNGS
jgi:N6-adenosine-specific RNA methylase IME4